MPNLTQNTWRLSGHRHVFISLPFARPFPRLCLASKAFRKFARQISLPRPREQKNALREQEEEEEKSTGDDEKTGRVYCVIIFTMGNGVEKKKKKKGIRVNSHEDGDIWRETHRCLRISFFGLAKWKCVIIQKRADPPPSPFFCYHAKEW